MPPIHTHEYREGILQHLQEDHREVYEREVMGSVTDSDQLLTVHQTAHEEEDAAKSEPHTPEIRPALDASRSVGPVARIMAYEDTTMLFDDVVTQNIATRQIFTRSHYRADGSVLSVVVELPETYTQFPPVEAGPDLTGVHTEDLLAEIRRRVEEVERALDYNDQEET